MKRTFQTLRSVAVAAVIGLTGVGTAGAQQAGQSSEPNWTGSYLGVNAGMGRLWAGDRMSFENNGFFFFDSNSGVFERAARSDRHGDGFVFGGVAGYNWQMGRIVAGLEADLTIANLNTDRKASGSSPFNYVIKQNVEADWVATLRPRLGVTVDRALIFATAGVALGGFSMKHDYVVYDSPSKLFASRTNIAASKTLVGTSIGAGIDYALDKNWVLRFEGQYDDFGSFGGKGDAVNDSGPASLKSKTDVSVGLLRFGVNYRM